MIQFRIDPEFANLLPPISGEEFQLLEESIVEEGRVREPLVVWQGILIDGHNRWKVIQKYPNVEWEVREVDFPDKWAALGYVYKNQLGRRNLTDEQRTYTIGKMYESRKKSVGAPIGNMNAEKQSGQNDRIESRRETKDGTAGQIGKEVGMGRRTCAAPRDSPRALTLSERLAQKPLTRF